MSTLSTPPTGQEKGPAAGKQQGPISQNNNTSMAAFGQGRISQLPNFGGVGQVSGHLVRRDAYARAWPRHRLARVNVAWPWRQPR